MAFLSTQLAQVPPLALAPQQTCMAFLQTWPWETPHHLPVEEHSPCHHYLTSLLAGPTKAGAQFPGEGAESSSAGAQPAFTIIGTRTASHRADHVEKRGHTAGGNPKSQEGKAVAISRAPGKGRKLELGEGKRWPLGRRSIPPGHGG
jgi:hypothetical protein